MNNSPEPPRKKSMYDFVDIDENKYNNHHNHNNQNIEKNQQEFGQRKRIKP